MTGMPFLKRFCPMPVLRYCDTLPNGGHLAVLAGDCASPEPIETVTEGTGMFSGRSWV